MIGYALVGSNDLERSRAFYDALFAVIGARRVLEFPSGGSAWGVARGQPMFGMGPPFNGAAATPGNGNQVSLLVESRALVDLLHARAIELGGSDEGAPGVRGAGGLRAFYGAYFRDPDGNKLCAYWIGPD